MNHHSIINNLKIKFIQSHYVLMKANINTLPLLFPEKKICLFLNEKAGCTFATSWFFFQQGLLEEALDYHFWIHNYRYDVYYKQKIYKSTLKSILSENFTRIKLVRSPFQRAVSSYIHAIKTKYTTTEISDFLGRKVNDDEKFTFEEFVEYLEKSGVENCNPHHRVQVEKLEKAGLLQFDKIIKLEESLPAFRQIENELGLKQSNPDLIFESISKSRHHRKRINSDEYCGNRMFKQKDAAFSQYQAFYNNSLKQKIANLYTCDFEHYNYAIDEI